MHVVTLLAAAGGDGQIEQIARTFGVDWSHLAAQVISFCIVCVLLQRFAYKPVLKMLAERRRQIAQGQENAEQIKAKAQEASVQERARMLAELKSEFGRLVVQTTATVTGKVLTAEDQQR